MPEKTNSSPPDGRRVGVDVIHPYISARFGRYTKGPGLKRTPRIKGDATNDRGQNVDFEQMGAHRTLLVPRVPNDNGMCYIDVWHDVGGMSGQHIGSAIVEVSNFELDDYREDTLTVRLSLPKVAPVIRMPMYMCVCICLA